MSPQRAGHGGPETERAYLVLGMGEGRGSGKASWREEVGFEPGLGLGGIRKEARVSLMGYKMRVGLYSPTEPVGA